MTALSVPRATNVQTAEALGIRDRRAVQPLLNLLEDSDPEIRYKAIFALGVLGATTERCQCSTNCSAFILFWQDPTCRMHRGAVRAKHGS
jgi:HEAT repeat protein